MPRNSVVDVIMKMASAPAGAKPRATNPTSWERATYETKIDYKNMNSYWAEYRRDSLVRQCINVLAYFTVHAGYRINVRGGNSRESGKFNRYLNQLDQRINIEDAIYIGLIGKRVWGRFGFEIVRDGQGEVVQLLPLWPPEKLLPKFNKNFVLEGFEFQQESSATPIMYKPEEILYFVDSSIKNDMRGLSSIEPIMTACEIKRKLYNDLEEASKRLWAPIGIFQMDTSGCDSDEEADQALEDFESKIEPGKPVVTNSTVEGTFFNAMPDIDRIGRAIEKVDEEIMGNFGIPKALVAREKSLNRATLEYSLQALYQSQIEGLQQYFSREIQSQLLHLIRDEKLGESSTMVCELIWNPRTSLDLDRQFGPAIKLYAMGLIDEEYLYDLLSLDKNRMPDFTEPEGKEEKPSPKARYDPDTLRAILSEQSNEELETVKQVIAEGETGAI